MKKFFSVGVFILLAVTAVAFADTVEKIVFEVDTYGVHAAFASNHTITNCGTLNWSGGAVAKVYTVGNPLPLTFVPTVTATFTNGTDTSSGTLAGAIFGSLNFTVSLKQSGFNVGSFSGTLYSSHKYVENEIYEGTVLDGAAVVTLTSFIVTGYDWSEGIGQPTGLRAQTSLSTSINDYQSDWGSNNVKITILADESGIPEPATMSLLSIGALGLLRRKK